MIIALWWITTAIILTAAMMALQPKWISKLFGRKYYCKHCACDLEEGQRYIIQQQIESDRAFTIRQA